MDDGQVMFSDLKNESIEVKKIFKFLLVLLKMNKKILSRENKLCLVKKIILSIIFLSKKKTTQLIRDLRLKNETLI